MTRIGASPALTSHNGHSPRLAEPRLEFARAEILIVDDSMLHRDTLAAVILASGGCVADAAWDLLSLRRALDEFAPDIVLLSMATRDSHTLIHLVRETHPQTKVIVTGLSDDDDAGIIGCAEAGVAGYHLRTESLGELLVIIGRVLTGESHCPPVVSAILLRRLSTLAARRQLQPGGLVLLTSRELQVLRMLEMGMSNRDIAGGLCIAVHTVKNHVHNVLTKLGVSTRTAAAAYSRSIRYDGIGGDLGATPA